MINKIILYLKNKKIKIKENDIFEFLKIYNRWPKQYSWGQPSIEVINAFGEPHQFELFDSNNILNFNQFIKYYNNGFTFVLSNILDFNSNLRELESNINNIIGGKINGNFYFGKGRLIGLPSFPNHYHNYHVIVKQIYGECIWKIEDKTRQVKQGEIVYIKPLQKHQVVESKNSKLSLTINLNLGING